MAIPWFGEKKFKRLHIGSNFGLNRVQTFSKSEGLAAGVRSHADANRYTEHIQIGDIAHLADARRRGELPGMQQCRLRR